MHQPVRVDLPYPKLDHLEPDLRAAEIIAASYASAGSELGAVLQYLYHHFQYGERGMQKYADTMENISIAEMTHFDLLGTALIRLGVDPVYTSRPPRRYDYFNTSRLAYSRYPLKMLLDDIQSEEAAIAQYEDMISCLRNEEIAALIQRIVMDERLHVMVLKALLEEVNQ